MDRDWSIEGDGGEPLHVYARGLDRRVTIRASGPVVLDADGLAKVISELAERLSVIEPLHAPVARVSADDRARWREAAAEAERAPVCLKRGISGPDGHTDLIYVQIEERHARALAEAIPHLLAAVSAAAIRVDLAESALRRAENLRVATGR